MWHRCISVFALGLCIGCAANQSLGAATLLVDDRYVEHEFTLNHAGEDTRLIGGDRPSVPGADFAVASIFDDLLTPTKAAEGSSWVSQFSTLSPADGNPVMFNLIEATGRIIDDLESSSAVEGGSTRSMTTMSVDFSLDAPHAYSIVGNLSKEASFAGAATASSAATVSLLELGQGAGIDASATGDGPVDLSGLLQPGDYRLAVQATTDTSVTGIGTAAASASFEQIVFELVEVPEPNTFGLLAAGALMALNRRRSHRTI